MNTGAGRLGPGASRRARPRPRAGCPRTPRGPAGRQKCSTMERRCRCPARHEHHAILEARVRRGAIMGALPRPTLAQVRRVLAPHGSDARDHLARGDAAVELAPEAAARHSLLARARRATREWLADPGGGAADGGPYLAPLSTRAYSTGSAGPLLVPRPGGRRAAQPPAGVTPIHATAGRRAGRHRCRASEAGSTPALAGAWPWVYHAIQHFTLTPSSLTVARAFEPGHARCGRHRLAPYSCANARSDDHRGGPRDLAHRRGDEPTELVAPPAAPLDRGWWRTR